MSGQEDNSGLFGPPCIPQRELFLNGKIADYSGELYEPRFF